MKDLTDETVGRYQIKELIGEGAMAKVYRAYDPEINRSLALKVLKSDFNVDEEYLSRFLREAKAAGALSHNNIVTVYDIGKVESSPYIMMELLSGSDLGEMLNKRRTFSVKDTLIIALQLAKALDYAHQAGVVHRDIKPDNIMVLDDDVSIKVADFGIARINENEEAQKTQVGSVLGTPRYMSPEQALGQDVDGRTDLYSVGVILYEMLTGEKAFDAANLGTLMTQIIQQQPTSLRKAYPDLPPGLCQIVQKLLQKKPEKRFQTGEQLAQAISKELSVYTEQQENQKKNKYVPLKIRWTLYMGSIVALFMLISVSIVFNIQTSAMARQAVDSGTAFAKFVAIETAVPLLSEDWITLETFINEAASRKTFSYLIVTDREGIIRGSSDINLVGDKYQPLESEEEATEIDEVHTTSVELETGESVFNIEAPILFQSVTVGNIVLGLSQKSLNEVKSVTGWLMFLLALVTTIAVSVILFIFGDLVTKPLRLLNDSIKQVGDGDLDTRISLRRSDEIGELFETFNHMTASLQQSLTGSSHETDTSTLDTDASSESTPSKPDDSLINLDLNADADATIIRVDKPLKAQSKTEPEPKAEAKPEIESESKPKTESVPEPESKVTPKPKPRSRAKPKSTQKSSSNSEQTTNIDETVVLIKKTSVDDVQAHDKNTKLPNKD